MHRRHVDTVFWLMMKQNKQVKLNWRNEWKQASARAFLIQQSRMLFNENKNEKNYKLSCSSWKHKKSITLTNKNMDMLKGIVERSKVRQIWSVILKTAQNLKTITQMCLSSADRGIVS